MRRILTLDNVVKFSTSQVHVLNPCSVLVLWKPWFLLVSISNMLLVRSRLYLSTSFECFRLLELRFGKLNMNVCNSIDQTK